MARYQNGDRVVVTEGSWSGSAGEVIGANVMFDVRLDHNHLVRSFPASHLRRPWEVEGRECSACGKPESKELGPVRAISGRRAVLRPLR